MKSLNHIILPIFITLFFACEKQENNLKYDKSLAEIQTFELNEKLFDDSKEVEKLDTIMFNKFNDRTRINVYPNTNKLVIDFFKKNINFSEKLFYYGAITKAKNIFFLFSFEDKYFEYPSAQKGFLALKNLDNQKYTFVKVYHHVIENPEFFRSFYSNDYLLLWYTYDEAYHTPIECSTYEPDEKFCILKIKEDGGVIVLNETDSNEILNQEFGKLLIPKEYEMEQNSFSQKFRCFIIKIRDFLVNSGKASKSENL